MLTSLFLNLLTWRLADTNLGWVKCKPYMRLPILIYLPPAREWGLRGFWTERIFDRQIMTRLWGVESFKGRQMYAKSVSNFFPKYILFVFNISVCQEKIKNISPKTYIKRCKQPWKKYLAGSALTLARFLNSSSIGVTLSPGSVCIRFWMCWCRFRAGTSVLPERTAWKEKNWYSCISTNFWFVLYLVLLLDYWLWSSRKFLKAKRCVSLPINKTLNK